MEQQNNIDILQATPTKPDEPLVSIIVITYNSAKYVLETLESAKAQTYKNIELIVTDDCSTDNTFEICRKWIEFNKNRFVRTGLISVPKNTGIASNCNRGLNSSKGIWVKFIAGDDILMNNSIEELVQYLRNNFESKIKFLIHGFSAFCNKEFLPIFPPDKFIKGSAKQQLLYLLKRGNCVSGSTFFLERATLIALNGFDENYQMVEDYPLLIKFTQNNCRIYLVNKALVKYRIHGNNISLSGNPDFYDSFTRYFDEILFPLWVGNKLYFWSWQYLLRQKNRNLNKFVKKLLILISPLDWIIIFYKIFGKSYYYSHKLIPKTN